MVAKISSLVVVISVLFSSYIFLDNRHAKADDVNRIEKKLKVNDINWLIIDTKKEYYFHLDMQRKYPKNRDILDKVVELKKEIELLEKRKNSLLMAD